MTAGNTEDICGDQYNCMPAEQSMVADTDMGKAHVQGILGCGQGQRHALCHRPQTAPSRGMMGMSSTAVNCAGVHGRASGPLSKHRASSLKADRLKMPAAGVMSRV